MSFNMAPKLIMPTEFLGYINSFFGADPFARKDSWSNFVKFPLEIFCIIKGYRN